MRTATSIYFTEYLQTVVNQAAPLLRSQVRTHQKSRVIRLCLFFAIFILVLRAFVLPIKVSGNSMYPTYQDGSLRFMNKLSYAAFTPKRGDVVVVQFPAELILKRVIGMPGETVSTRRGQFLIDGKPLPARLKFDSAPYYLAPHKLKADEYFVVGDNREVSIYARVDADQIKGKLLY